MRVAKTIELDEQTDRELRVLSQRKRIEVRLQQRARIVLLAAKGMQNKDIAQQLDVGRVQVSRWRKRYAQSRLPGIERDLPRGAPPVKGMWPGWWSRPLKRRPRPPRTGARARWARPPCT